MNILQHRNPEQTELDSWERADPDNSLPRWAALLVELRKIPATNRSASPTNVSSSTTVPAITATVHDQLQTLLTRVETGPPLRLHLEQLQNLLIDSRPSTADVRQAIAFFHAVLGSPEIAAYRPFLREMTGRLVRLGDAYRQQN
ncbi:MAG: hypothetical protein FWC56_03395, partial [Phycisphaerae bacterium]|nr:hypothetical protein [Phycisphaerae bacterium]